MSCCGPRCEMCGRAKFDDGLRWCRSCLEKSNKGVEHAVEVVQEQNAQKRDDTGK